MDIMLAVLYWVIWGNTLIHRWVEFQNPLYAKHKTYINDIFVLSIKPATIFLSQCIWLCFRHSFLYHSGEWKSVFSVYIRWIMVMKDTIELLCLIKRENIHSENVETDCSSHESFFYIEALKNHCMSGTEKVYIHSCRVAHTYLFSIAFLYFCSI